MGHCECRAPKTLPGAAGSNIIIIDDCCALVNSNGYAFAVSDIFLSDALTNLTNYPSRFYRLGLFFCFFYTDTDTVEDVAPLQCVRVCGRGQKPPRPQNAQRTPRRPIEHAIPGRSGPSLPHSEPTERAQPKHRAGTCRQSGASPSPRVIYNHLSSNFIIRLLQIFTKISIINYSSM